MKSIDKGEIGRKCVHYTASLIPILCYIIDDRNTALIILGSCTVAMFIAEILRMYNSYCIKLYAKVFGWMTRQYELDRHITGATYVFLGSFLTVFLFQKEVAVTALLFLTVGDPTACLVGLAFGKSKLLNKTLEGTLAFVVSGFLATLWVPGVPLLVKLIGVVFASLVELIPWKVDDNITIPLISGMVLMILL